MKSNKTPFSILIIAAIFNIITSCTGEDNSNESVKKDDITLSSRSNLSSAQTAKLIAFDIFTLNEFTERNHELFEENQNEISQSNEASIIDLLNTKQFEDVNSISLIMNDYNDHLENLNYYFDLEMRENNLTNIQSTNIFNLVIEELNFLYLQRYPPPPSGGTCLQEWQNDMQDCRDDALIGSATSIVAAGAGIIPGLLGAAATMWQFRNCKKAAQRDYELCMS